MEPQPLFADGDLRATLDNERRKAEHACDQVSEADLRSLGAEAMAAQLTAQFRVEPITLTEGAVSVWAQETAIDPRKLGGVDSFRFSGEAGGVPGVRVTFSVPFTGDPALLKCTPSTFTASVPYAVIRDGALQFISEVRSEDVAAAHRAFARDVADTKRWLGWANAEVVRFNDELPIRLARRLRDRLSRLEQATAGLQALGIPIRPPEGDRQPRRPPPAAANPTRGPSISQSRDAARYDVALSFAGEDRQYVRSVANSLKSSGIAVFYDEFEAVELWGKDLVAHLQSIYQEKARFCVIFVSRHYLEKPWPRHERRSAQARQLVANEEYLLPARFDDSELPGLPPTIGYVDLRNISPEDLAQMIRRKLGRATADA